MNDRWVDRLSDYLDGELSPAETAELERHLEGCATCRQSIAELRTVVARLASDPVNPADQPTRAEWNALRGRILPRRRRWVVPAGIAASLIGVAVLGSLLGRNPGPAPVPNVYEQATLELEAVLRQNQGRLRPETGSALENSLMAIDSAIVRAERARAADTANDYVSRSVEQLRDARLTMLRRAVAAATSVGT